MDSVRANRIANELIGKCVANWRIDQFINAGKSAAVFSATQDGRQAALKVFDPELVERFGRSVQLARIERERSLIGDRHTNLIEILGGGECPSTHHLFVAMELIEAPNLGDSLTLVPRDRIWPIIQQVAMAVRFLEDKGLAHRDIKPDNIAIFPDFARAVLLDLGVVRPIGASDLTDDEARVFIGTLRYSSPELLTRVERDDTDGWRAVTFYQLGAVLHDLIMRRPLFQEFSDPYAVLVEAVKSERPEINAPDVGADLVLLAQNCLVKDPGARLSLVSWNDFAPRQDPKIPFESARERVRKRALLARAQPGSHASTGALATGDIYNRVAEQIDNIIRLECAGSDSFPPMEIIQEFSGSTSVRVTFAASQDRSLPNELSIQFDCKLVDQPTMTISVVASAALLPHGNPHGCPPSSVPVFRGPVDSAVLATRVQETLWSAVDLAQQQSQQLLASGKIAWLALACGSGEDG